MRKKLFALLIGILAVTLLTLLLTACAGVNLTLTFEVDGEAYATVTTSGQEAVQMPKDPTKEGYLFDGWYWDKDVWEKPFTANSLLETPLTESMTVYAKWKEEAEEHVHSYGEWTVETAATCTTEGLEKRVCECGEEETRTTEKLLHSYGEWTVETDATCTAEGTEKRVCECGEEETRAIAKLAHTYEEKYDATNHWKECSVCHEEIDKAAHSYGEWTVVNASTCAAEGIEKRVCSVCEEEETRVIEKIPHSFGEWTVETAATCTAEGLEKRVCECGEEETRVTEKLPHSFGEWTVTTAATCATEGLEKRVCECGEEETKTIAIKAHDYITKYDEANHWKECSLCKDKKDEAEHTYVSGACTICGKLLPTEGLEYNKIEGGYEVAGIGTAEGGNIVIPSMFNGEPVIGIGNNAFIYSSELINVEIPSSVTVIGDSAFFLSSLVSINIPNGVISIGNDAFKGCSSLASIVIPESVIRIGDVAFQGCSSLKSVEIPSSVTSIGGNPFAGCESLETLTVAEGNTKYYSEVNCLIETETKTLISGCKNSIIPMDGSVTSIGFGAFYGCSGLVSVVIPVSVTSIGFLGFSNCSSLEMITVAEGNTKYHSEGNCLIETETKTLITGCKNSIIPTDGSVTSIGAYAFESCSSLVSIVIPSSVTSIGNSAFFDCSSLVSIEIPSSVTSIADLAFYACSSLKSIVIQDSVTSIGSFAFRGCSSLVSVVIPSSVTSIGFSAFENCSRLESIEYGGTKEEWIKITKGSDWNYNTGNYTVTCTNGTLSKAESML